MQLLRMEEVANILGVTRDRAYRLARNGTIPVVHIGRHVRVEEQMLYEWIRNGGRQICEK